ncbi:hypothetical protein EGW08_005525 [Elysia chlorotica]|uniref:Uncharacterized protein n=1 Tax=Elysia chlorotica TaxID=188477 RepID=A0A433TYV5_ELYCH|nr:hypothetical protein EGW08_005525 [Elysia chlorotica]
MLDTIHQQGLHLSLGAFRTTQVESLYVAADEPSLSERRDKISLQYAVNLKSHPDNPAFCPVFHPTYVEKFQSSPNAIPPFGIRVQQLLLEIDLDTNSIQEDKFSEIPPWTLERPGSILYLAALQNDKTPPEVSREKFEQIIENHSENYMCIYFSLTGLKLRPVLELPVTHPQQINAAGGQFAGHSRLANGPQQPTREGPQLEVFTVYPTSVVKFQSSPSAIPPLGSRVQQLLLEIDLDTNSIQEDKYSEIPPWTLD